MSAPPASLQVHPGLRHRWRLLDASEPASPCVAVCHMHQPTGWCRGCLRTLEEIAQWSCLPAVQKLALWQRIATRMQQVDGEGLP